MQKKELQKEDKWPLGKKVHIVVDEVPIKPEESFLPNFDKFVGHVFITGVVQPKENGKLAIVNVCKKRIVPFIL